MCIFLCTWTPEVNVWCLSPNSVSDFGQGLSLTLELASLARLTGQEESGILLSHPFQDLALRCVLPRWDFYMGCIFISYYLYGEHFNNWTISAAPHSPFQPFIILWTYELFQVWGSFYGYADTVLYTDKGFHKYWSGWIFYFWDTCKKPARLYCCSSVTMSLVANMESYALSEPGIDLSLCTWRFSMGVLFLNTNLPWSQVLTWRGWSESSGGHWCQSGYLSLSFLWL